MSTPESEPIEPTSDAEESSAILEPYSEPPPPEPPPPLPARSGWMVTAQIPNAGREPSPGLTDVEAEASWNAVTAPWHPAILARSAALPRIESIDAPSSPARDEVRIVVDGLLHRLPSGFATNAADCGAVLIEAAGDRDRTVAELRERLGIPPESEGADKGDDRLRAGIPPVDRDPAPDSSSSDPSGVCLPPPEEKALQTPHADDFLALGLTRWMVCDLIAAMGRPEALNEEMLARETFAAADAWVAGDSEASANRLKAAFEVLTQAREAVYSIDAYLIDLCLLDPALPAGAAAAMLDLPAPLTFLASAQAIEAQAKLDPNVVPRLGQAISDGWLDVVGGTYAEAEDPLLPVESTLWQFRKGAEVYRENLDERNVETYARRRFGLWPQVPQLSRKFGYRYAVHFAFDGARFPVRREPKRLWEGPEGSTLETLFRLPIAADRPSQGPLFAWKLAATMRADHSATITLVHWPSPTAGWYRDLRRASTHSPSLARWVTLDEYFQRTDRPYESFRPEPDDYASPFLAQAAASRDPAAVSRFATHHRLRARLEAVHWMRTMSRAVAASRPEAVVDAEAVRLELGPIEDAESLLETRRHDEAASAIDALESEWSRALARDLNGSAEPKPGARPGFLVFNPLAVARKVAVTLPGASPDLRPEGPLIAAQLTDEGVVAVVDLPAFGFAWVPRDTDPERPAAESGMVSASGRIVKNEKVEVEFDKDTGGIRGIMAIGESTARLGQQVVATGLGTGEGRPAASRMKAEAFEVEYAGPAMAQAVSTSAVVDPSTGKTVARVEQRCRLWAGRSIVELSVKLRDVDPEWAARAVGADPWSHHLAYRWAWPDASSMIRRMSFLSPEPTDSERPETPDAVDVSTRRQRTAILFGGLPFHKKAGQRMLDTILVAGSEQEREFRAAVVVDDDHPHRSSSAFLTPAVVVPSDFGPPPAGDRGWLMKLDSQAPAIVHVGFTPETYDGRGWGIDVHLVETVGYHARCRLQFFRAPTWARQFDLQGESQGDLTVDGDAVWLDLMAGELYRVVVAFG